jgi:hypothetical protein
VPLPRNLVLAALPVLAAGCLYDYKNPAEQLRAGEASGTVLAERTGPGVLEAFPGVSVSLKGSAFDQVTRASGRFALVDLPVGRHTLLFRQGATWSLEKDVEIAFGKDGQPEGVDLGKVVLRYTTPVEGRVALPAGTFLGTGVAVDETSGATAMIQADVPYRFDFVLGQFVGSSTGTYRFPGLAPGSHVIKVAAYDAAVGGVWVADQIRVAAIDEAAAGQVRTLPVVSLRPSFTDGRIRFRVQLVGNPGITMADVTVKLIAKTGGIETTTTVSPDSQGFVDETVPEGIYQVQVIAPVPLGRQSGAGPVSLATVSTPGIPVGPPASYGVVLNGKVAEVGSVYVVSDLVVSFSSGECRVASDCGTDSGGSGQPGTTFQCNASQCFGCFASAGPPICSPIRPSLGVAGSVPFCGACDPNNASGTCAAGPGIDGFCTPQGACLPFSCAPVFSCTPDGVSIASTDPSSC